MPMGYAARGRQARQTRFVELLLIGLFAFALVQGCGGGGSTSSELPPPGNPPPSFSIGVNPAILTIPPNTTVPVSLTLAPANGFSGVVTVGVSGLPAGLTI